MPINNNYPQHPHPDNPHQHPDDYNQHPDDYCLEEYSSHKFLQPANIVILLLIIAIPLSLFVINTRKQTYAQESQPQTPAPSSSSTLPDPTSPTSSSYAPPVKFDYPTPMNSMEQAEFLANNTPPTQLDQDLSTNINLKKQNIQQMEININNSLAQLAEPTPPPTPQPPQPSQPAPTPHPPQPPQPSSQLKPLPDANLDEEGRFRDDIADVNIRYSDRDIKLIRNRLDKYALHNNSPDPSNIIIDPTYTASDLQKQLVMNSLNYYGLPYIWGGEGPTGYDCSGFVRKVYRNFGINLPRVSADQAQVGKEISDMSDLQAGDLVFMDTRSYYKYGEMEQRVTHVGMYIGEGKMIHASSVGKQVAIGNLTDKYFATRIVTVRRFI